MSEVNKEKAVSKKQKNANRENAQKSTGPKTSQGKEISSQNSTKHGIFARDTILNSVYHKENQYEYDQLLESLCDELKPTTGFQKTLVGKIMNALWRSHRAITAETAIVNRQLDALGNNHLYNNLSEQLQQIPEFPYDPNIVDDMQEVRAQIAQKRANLVGRNVIPPIEYCMTILHYEMRLDKQLSRTYRLLRLLQLRDMAESKLENNNSSTNLIADPSESTSD